MNRTAEDFDHAHDLRKHDTPSNRGILLVGQQIMIAKLIGALEGVASSGVLPADAELDIRAIVADALACFRLPSQAEIHGGVQ